MRPEARPVAWTRTMQALRGVFGLFGYDSETSSTSRMPAASQSARLHGAGALGSGEMQTSININAPTPGRLPGEDAEWTPNAAAAAAATSSADDALRSALIRRALSPGVRTGPISEDSEQSESLAQRLANIDPKDYPRVQFVQGEYRPKVYSPSHMNLTVNQSLCIAFMLVLLLLSVSPSSPAARAHHAVHTHEPCSAAPQRPSFPRPRSRARSESRDSPMTALR